jgi:thiol:disulfide interchange protein DsbC
VSAADVGFPALFSNFDVLVTHGTHSVGQIFGGGKFSFDATAGTYFVDFIALPSGTDKAGTYSLAVVPTPPAPTVTLNSNVTHVVSGGTVTLTWTSQNATTCAASGGWSGTQQPNGSATSTALSGATTFTLTCSGDGGSANKSVAITIDSPTSPSGGGGHGGGAFSLLTLLGLIGALAMRLARWARMSRGDTGAVRCVVRSGARDTNSAILKGFAASVVVLLPLLARAGDGGATASSNELQPMAKIRATMQERYPGAKLETIKPSKLVPGWYELLVGQQIVYADRTADHLIVGKVVDTRTRQDLTEKTWSDAHRVDFKALPFEHSIKTVRGKGEHVVAIFEDPLCPFCQKLEQQMQGVDDVTIYTFLLPLESVHPGATVKSREIWCAKDRAAAWSNWMLKHAEPGDAPAGQCNEDPTGLLLETASKLNINATPTLIFADGHRVVEAPSPEALESDLQHSILPN